MSTPAKASSAGHDLQLLRAEIERIDREIVSLVAERVRLAREVGKAKRAADLPTLDPAREAAVVRRAGALAREAGLVDEEMRALFWHLIGLSRRAQVEGE
ncbi:MAG TPA: chorismate mutase [Longimicrobiaceae bacterium]|jgi:monofunctional chorismate mutase|nr:chorismate mutase [Longimicrobiaceae bacterium]